MKGRQSELLFVIPFRSAVGSNRRSRRRRGGGGDDRPTRSLRTARRLTRRRSDRPAGCYGVHPAPHPQTGRRRASCARRRAQVGAWRTRRSRPGDALATSVPARCNRRSTSERLCQPGKHVRERRHSYLSALVMLLLGQSSSDATSSQKNNSKNRAGKKLLLFHIKVKRRVVCRGPRPPGLVSRTSRDSPDALSAPRPLQ